MLVQSESRLVALLLGALRGALSCPCLEAKPEKDGTWSTGQTWCWAPNNSTKQLGRS